MSEKRPDIICTPVLTFTQSDANHVAGKCPYKFVEGKENLLAVFPFLDKEGIESRTGVLHVVHYVKNDKTDEQGIEGEWQCKVPILQTPNKHIFQVEIKYA